MLRGRNLGEADRIFTLFTASRGKLDAVAKGVRRTKSHFAGRLEFLSEAELTLHRGRSLDVITSAALVRTRWDALVEPVTFGVASLVVESIDAFCEPDLALPDVYALLRGFVGALGAVDDARLLIPRFGLRLLDALGLAPASDACVRCGAPLIEDAWLDADAGGLACAACRRGRDAVVGMDAADIQNFRALGAARGGGERATLVATAASARAVEFLIAHHLGKRSRSSAMLDELAHAGGRPAARAKPPE